LKNLDALKGSLRRFGLRRPIIANERDGQIEAGHQTRQALLELGATHIPVIWADDDRIQATAFNIADNKTAEVVADWDEDALTKLLTDINAAGDLDGMGFDDKEAERLLAGLGESDEDEPAPEEDASETPKEMYRIMIECEDEAHQSELLARFMEEGIPCQSLIL
jgi:ParB-like chromosome segregation protein Spo0J